MSEDRSEIELRSPDGLSIRLLTLGASWVGCRLRLRDGRQREVLLGFDSMEAHRSNRAYVGATVGRWANRIAGSMLQRDGQSWPLATETGLDHQLHGGPGGFHQKTWTLLEHSAKHALLGLHSPDGDQGFPGALDVQLRYELGPGLTVTLAFEAWLHGTLACPVSLTNHAYFQLDGTPTDVRQQSLQLAAERYLPVNERGLPLTDPLPVAGTRFDFNRERPMDGAFDHAFLLQGGALLRSADRLVALKVETSMPAMQIYTGEFLPEGTGGRFPRFGGMALEPGWLPDSPHHPHWPQPDCWLKPGQRWRHHIVYRFEV